MKKPKSSIFIALIVGAVLIVAAFLYWDYENKRAANECDLLMKGTVSNLSFNLGDNNFHFGEKIEQKLNESVHEYAVRLKSCCIEHQAKRIDQNQYMSCRNEGERLTELQTLLKSYEKVDGEAKKSLFSLIEKNISDVTGEKPNKPLKQAPVSTPSPQEGSQSEATPANTDESNVVPATPKDTASASSDIVALISEDSNFATGLGLGIEKTQEQKNYDEFIKIQNEAQKSTGFAANPSVWMQEISSSSNPQAAIEKLRKVKADYFAIVLPAAERLLGTENLQYKALKKLNDEIKFDDM